MKKEVVKGRRGLSGCIGTHCLKSVRLAPSWTASWAWEPLYCTTLTLDSLPANWKKKSTAWWTRVLVCVLCLRACAFLCQHFCVPPILTNYIRTGRGESLERHKSQLPNPRQYLSFTLSILRGLFFLEGIISQQLAKRSSVLFWINTTNHREDVGIRG